ncbi:hypothetical protein [Flavobacterium sp. CAN_S2]|uniref:hypothetical protein n=1 Tax=Flavobacterium sp. CAN_S2 TaxID=2787726 RepID=UPI0018C9AB7D
MNWFKKTTEREIKIGDWVNSYSKGIFRVERIVQEYYDESNRTILGENKIGDKFKNRTIISKKFLNSKMKKSISYENCSESCITFLSKEIEIELNQIIEQNPKLLIEFNQYAIPEIIGVYNSQLQIETAEELQKVTELLKFIENGRSFLEIENEMKKLDILKLKPKYFGNYNFQLFNFNHEYIEKKQIWREGKLTKKET